MALSNTDNPNTDPIGMPPASPVVELGGVDITEHVAEPTALPSPKKANKAKAELDKPVLANAFTSGNGEVHYLVAERQTAVSNQDADRVAEMDAKLADLGYSVVV